MCMRFRRWRLSGRRSSLPSPHCRRTYVMGQGVCGSLWLDQRSYALANSNRSVSSSVSKARNLGSVCVVSERWRWFKASCTNRSPCSPPPRLGITSQAVFPEGSEGGRGSQWAYPAEKFGEELLRLGERGEVSGVLDKCEPLGWRLHFGEVPLGQAGQSHHIGRALKDEERDLEAGAQPPSVVGHDLLEQLGCGELEADEQIIDVAEGVDR